MAEQGDKAGTGEPVRRWTFGPAVLDERTLELAVNGDAVSLERKQLEVLLFLLNHAGEVVTRDEILEAVWPGRILTETVLTKCIHKLREALGDEDQSLIKTQHGYGYRLVAQVKVEASTARPPPRFAFKRDDRSPLRPLWKLIERLGTGGHGEAWLARHEKTGEARVFKFADTPETLVSLKREITLYRLLRDTLGERPDFVHILDWNLEEVPYFFEADYTEGGNLIAWAEGQGGLRNIPLATRLGLAAQIAEALAAAHSVGVLHKDLKPSNVLIEAKAGESPRIKLADFGSGGVLDLSRLEALGITRLGFTHTVKTGTTSGTPLYFAPEVIAGQPFTVQADVYALGVMLYQLVVGDLNQSLAPGWEQEVGDDLLREDIALAAAGKPDKRLADAVQLAQRLRSLESRRHERSAEREAQAETERTRQMLARIRGRRRWVAAAASAVAIGTSIVGVLYVRAESARREAEQSAATTQAVIAFLARDLLSSKDPETGVGRGDLTVREVLDRAAGKVDQRFPTEPAVAAQVFIAMSWAYAALGDLESARAVAARGAALQAKLDGPVPGWQAAALMSKEMVLSKGEALSRRACATTEDLVRRGIDETNFPGLILNVRLLGALCRASSTGAFEEARIEVEHILEEAASASTSSSSDAEFMAMGENVLSGILAMQGEYAAAERHSRRNYEHAVKAYGERHHQTVGPLLNHARVLAYLGRYEEAEKEIQQARAATVGGDPDKGDFLGALAKLRYEQGRLEEAASMQIERVEQLAADKGPEHPHSVYAALFLGGIHLRQEQAEQAHRVLQDALSLYDELQLADANIEPSKRFNWLEARVALADALRKMRRFPEAWAALKPIPAEELARLPPRIATLAELRRVQGLLWLDEADDNRARPALEEALGIYDLRFGQDNWRTQRAREELARVKGASRN